MISKILKKTSQIIEGIKHLSRVGSKASRLSFLTRERRKFLAKLGEETYALLKNGQLKHSTLQRIASQVDKIEELIDKADYGGQEGVAFGSEKNKPVKK